jgi:hypothetical protein
MSRAGRRFDELATRYAFELVAAVAELRRAWLHVRRAREALGRARATLGAESGPVRAPAPAPSPPRAGRPGWPPYDATSLLVCATCGRDPSAPSLPGPLYCLSCRRHMQCGGKA